jgi:hypothetical protein
MGAADNEQVRYADLVERLDRIADLIALTLIRDLESDEQIRILTAAAYKPAKIGAFLGMRPNTVSVVLSRSRRKATPRRQSRRSSGGH